MASEMKVAVMDEANFLASLRKKLPAKAKSFYAMYNSDLGAILTDPALMVIPMDDHMVHRGHAVFDTCNVVEGKAYGLDFHLDRLLKSAELARISFANEESREETKARLTSLVLATIAASKKRGGVLVRIWLSIGRGGFDIDPKECTGGPSFYVIVQDFPIDVAKIAQVGIKEVIVPPDVIPLKPHLLATMKSTNYMLNALVTHEAGLRGGHYGIQHDENGVLTEGAVCCYGFVGKDDVFRTPAFDRILRGTTLVQNLQALPQLKAEGLLKDFVQGPLPISVAYASKEVIQFVGGVVLPVVQVGDIVIGDGKPGKVFKRIFEYNSKDQLNPKHLLDIPYHLYE